MTISPSMFSDFLDSPPATEGSHRWPSSDPNATSSHFILAFLQGTSLAESPNSDDGEVSDRARSQVEAQADSSTNAQGGWWAEHPATWLNHVPLGSAGSPTLPRGIRSEGFPTAERAAELARRTVSALAGAETAATTVADRGAQVLERAGELATGGFPSPLNQVHQGGLGPWLAPPSAALLRPVADGSVGPAGPDALLAGSSAIPPLAHALFPGADGFLEGARPLVQPGFLLPNPSSRDQTQGPGGSESVPELDTLRSPHLGMLRGRDQGFAGSGPAEQAIVQVAFGSGTSPALRVMLAGRQDPLSPAAALGSGLQASVSPMAGAGTLGEQDPGTRPGGQRTFQLQAATTAGDASPSSLVGPAGRENMVAAKKSAAKRFGVGSDLAGNLRRSSGVRSSSGGAEAAGNPTGLLAESASAARLGSVDVLAGDDHRAGKTGELVQVEWTAAGDWLAGAAKSPTAEPGLTDIPAVRGWSGLESLALPDPANDWGNLTGPRHVSPTTAGPAVSAELNATGRVVADAVLYQVTQTLRQVPAGDSTMRLQLNPLELGQLEIEISFRNGVMMGKIRAEQGQTWKLLQEGLEGLRSRLHEHGIVVQSLEVELGQPGDFSQQSRQSPQHFDLGQQRQSSGYFSEEGPGRKRPRAANPDAEPNSRATKSSNGGWAVNVVV
jgi:hypothetical protein